MKKTLCRWLSFLLAAWLCGLSLLAYADGPPLASPPDPQSSPQEEAPAGPEDPPQLKDEEDGEPPSGPREDGESPEESSQPSEETEPPGEGSSQAPEEPPNGPVEEEDGSGPPDQSPPEEPPQDAPALTSSEFIEMQLKHYMLKYPYWSWPATVGLHGASDYRILTFWCGFTPEEAEYILEGGITQEKVDEVIARNNYWGLPKDFFYSGEDITLEEVLADYLRFPDSYYEEAPRPRSRSGANSGSQKSDLSDHLDSSAEAGLARFLSGPLFQTSAKITSNNKWLYSHPNYPGHHGVDLAKDSTASQGGSEIPYYSLSGGAVVYAEDETGFGTLTVRTPDGSYFLYGHSKKLNVLRNDEIVYGQSLGTQGGRGTRKVTKDDGTVIIVSDVDFFDHHVHFEVHDSADTVQMHPYGAGRSISPYLAIQHIASNDSDYMRENENPCPHADTNNDKRCNICGISLHVPATGIALNKTKLVLKANAAFTLIATTTPANSTDPVTWRSSNTAVATVDKNGRVTARQGGSATITATANGISATCTVAVPYITLSPTTATIYTTSNGTHNKVTLKPAFGPAGDSISWTSSNTAVATVSNGVVTAKKAGTTTITARTSSGVTATATITVKAPSIALNRDSATIYTGSLVNAVQLTASGTPSTTYSWASSNTAVAAVDSKSGRVTAKRAGSAVITCTGANGTSARCTITVRAPSLSVSPTSVTLYTSGTRTRRLSASTSPTAAVTWRSSNPAVATVNSSGSVTALKAGTVTITATANGLSSTCKVTVKRPTITWSASASSMYVGESASFTARATPSATVNYTSNNTSVAIVSSSGRVTARGAGSATITASANGVSSSKSISVKKPSIKWSNASKTLYAGWNYTFKATPTPSASVRYSSSNTYVATINSAGRVSARNPGTSTITATANGVTATYTITVKKPTINWRATVPSLRVGSSYTFVATPTPSTATVVYSSSNPNVARITSNGKVTARSAGYTTITAKISGTDIKCTYTLSVRR